MSNLEAIQYLLKKYNLTRYKFTNDLKIEECGLCNGIFFNYSKDTLLILKTKGA